MYQHVLIPTDGSQRSNEALPTAWTWPKPSEPG